MRDGERRLVARFAAAILHRFQQGAFLALDVAARTDEYVHGKRDAGAENVGAADAVVVGFFEGLAVGIEFIVIFMANVQRALGGAGDQPGQDHALDDEMGSARAAVRGP